MDDVYTNREQQEREAQAFAEQVDNLDSSELPTANIMVAGITGTGKSTLINAIFGEDFAETGIGRPVTQNVNEYNSENLPIRIWDTVGLELDAETTKKSIKDIKDKIAQKAESKDQFDRIHAIWYCVNSRSSRYQGAELDFIKNLHSVGVPFIIVLTQCIGDEDEVNAFEQEIRKINSNMGLDDVDVVQVCAQDFKMRGVPPILAFGLDELVDITTKKLPAFIKSGFIASQKVSKVQKRELCEDIIIEYIKAAKEGFWDKVPLANIIRANKRIMNMFRKIGLVYNTQIPEKSIERITNECGLDFGNIFFGLISPIDFGYSARVMALLWDKKKDGFVSVDSEILTKRNLIADMVADTVTFVFPDINPHLLKKHDRVAVMIALYGYTFIDSIEALWEKLTQSQLNDIDLVCDLLVSFINKNLNQKKDRQK